MKNKKYWVYIHTFPNGKKYCGLSTLENIKLNKIKTDNISCGVFCRLAKYFNVSMDTMYKQLMLPERKSFEWFRSEVCHRLKFLGDKEFVIRLVEEDYIR